LPAATSTGCSRTPPRKPSRLTIRGNWRECALQRIGGRPRSSARTRSTNIWKQRSALARYFPKDSGRKRSRRLLRPPRRVFHCRILPRHCRRGGGWLPVESGYVRPDHILCEFGHCLDMEWLDDYAGHWAGRKKTFESKVGARGCPLWVRSGRAHRRKSCPLCPRKRTCAVQLGMSAKCHKRTLAAYSIGSSASARRVGDRLSPRALAVLRLINSSKKAVGCSGFVRSDRS
jgi:hypothetical protein